MRADHREAPAARNDGGNDLADGRWSLPQIVDRTTDPARSLADHVTARHLQDMLSSGLAATWRRRQRVLLAARPRPEDFHGNASRAELSERWRRLTEQAAACGRAAELAEQMGGIFPEVWQSLDEARGGAA